MILDDLRQAKRYTTLGPRIAQGFNWLAQNDVLTLPPGRIDIQGDDVFALVQDIRTKPAEEGVWEAHQRYLDIQVPVSGDERMGWAHLNTLSVTQPYDPEKDFCLLSGTGLFLPVRAGAFALFWPQDAHIPGIAAGMPGPLRKVVIKVLI